MGVRCAARHWGDNEIAPGKTFRLFGFFSKRIGSRNPRMPGDRKVQFLPARVSLTLPTPVNRRFRSSNRCLAHRIPNSKSTPDTLLEAQPEQDVGRNQRGDKC